MVLFFFFKKKTAYEMRISDWSSDVCSSDLRATADTDRILWQLRRIHDETVLRSILPRVECARPQHDLLWNTRRRRTGPCMARRGAASEQGKRPRRPDRLRRKGCQPWPHGLAKARDHRHQRRRADRKSGL